MDLPRFSGECIGCFKCLLVCPGLAVTLVDLRKDRNAPLVAVPFEIERGLVKKGDKVNLTDWEGADLGSAQVADVKDFKAENTLLIIVKTTPDLADRIASIKLFDQERPLEASAVAASKAALSAETEPGTDDDTIICRCERVTLGEIRQAIRGGVRDMNQLKAVTRAGMGACGAKTCESLILSIFKSEGVDLKEVTGFSMRPLFVEAPLGAFTNVKCRTEQEEKASWSGF
jgi:bacterioferritin-associated ferredoxin/Fe-S-cluster-containing hydrogenase component 2